jgi:RNA polymerase sigma-70 factor (ECF subfamily)
MAVMTAQPLPVPAASVLGPIFEEHHGRVFRAAYRVTGNASDAEDVLQTVFLRLARQPESTLANPRSYLYRAAVNCALDQLRCRRSSPAVPLEGADRTGAPAVETDAAEAAELRRALRQALAGLHPRLAEVFVLRFVEGYENREIAQMLGTSRAVVAVTLHRARGRLKRELQAPAGGLR